MSLQALRIILGSKLSDYTMPNSDSVPVLSQRQTGKCFNIPTMAVTAGHSHAGLTTEPITPLCPAIVLWTDISLGSFRTSESGGHCEFSAFDIIEIKTKMTSSCWKKKSTLSEDPQGEQGDSHAAEKKKEKKKSWQGVSRPFLLISTHSCLHQRRHRVALTTSQHHMCEPLVLNVLITAAYKLAVLYVGRGNVRINFCLTCNRWWSRVWIELFKCFLLKGNELDRSNTVV